MANYFIRTNGSDSNAGTSASTAWRTIGKALGSAGISSGDIVYIGAGKYRESTTIAMTSATAETLIIGDIDGLQTGDAGEVILTTYLTNDKTLPLPTSLNAVINLSGRDFLTFRNITFHSYASGSTLTSTTTTATNIKFINCLFYLASNGSVTVTNITIGYGVEANWLFEKCIFASNSGAGVNITLASGAGPDYYANMMIKDCLFLMFGSSYGIAVSSSGSSSGEGGGVIVKNCTFLSGGGAVSTTGTSLCGSTFVNPVKVYNCLIINRSNTASLSSSELGNIIENYNIIISGTPRTNVTAGLQSISDGSVMSLIEFGQSYLYGFKNQPYGSFLKNSPLLSHGHQIIGDTNATDILNDEYLKGQTSLLFNGKVTSATEKTITDGSQSFGNSTLPGYTIKIVDGQGKGQSKTIQGNTPTVITGDGLWVTQPDSTSKYIVYQGPTNSSALVSTGSNITVTDYQAAWGINFWQGHTLRITSGTAKGTNFIVSGNSPTVASGYSTLGITPASGDVYELFYGLNYEGLVSTGTSSTITDNTISWNNNFWKTYLCMITSGTASGAYLYVSGNTNTVLSGWQTLAIIPASGDRYSIYCGTGYATGLIPSGETPKFGGNFVNFPVGCYSNINTAIKETGTVLSGVNAIKIFGPGYQDFYIPVNSGVSTSVKVWTYFDDYYSGTKPQLVIKETNYIQIKAVTGTAVGASGAWEQLTTTFTPSGNGIVTARLQSNASGANGSTYWDAFSVV